MFKKTEIEIPCKVKLPTIESVIAAWNMQTDLPDQWSELEEGEKIEFAMRHAICELLNGQEVVAWITPTSETLKPIVGGSGLIIQATDFLDETPEPLEGWIPLIVKPELDNANNKDLDQIESEIDQCIKLCPELCVGVSATTAGATVCIMQPHADGSCTVIYSETHPIGDSLGRTALSCQPDTRDAPTWQDEDVLRLNAAAPDLLDALECLTRELVLSDIDLSYMESHFRPWLNKAYSAVAKAEGKLFSPTPTDQLRKTMS